MADLTLSVHEVSKRYRVGTGMSGLRAATANLWRRPRPEDYHWAVREVSFSLGTGEALGIIGPNGSGKTTILKMLSRVTQPSSGTIQASGRLTALIELGAGFHPDLTGRENVYLNGAILGMRKSEIAKRFESIVEFAGVGNYIDTPVKRYSSGMYARLGFATAAHVDPEVLLVDEVLAVGDYAFQMKCYARMNELRARGTSIILVSHNLEMVRRVCSRALVMYRGRAIFQGDPHEAVAAYSDAVRQAARRHAGPIPAEGGLAERVMSFEAEVKGVRLIDAQGHGITVVRTGMTVRLLIDVEFHEDVESPVFGFFVFAEDGRRVYVTNTRWMDVATRGFEAGERCVIEFGWRVNLLDGTYDLGVDVTAQDLSRFHDRLERALSFSVTGPPGAEGLVDLSASVSVPACQTGQSVRDEAAEPRAWGVNGGPDRPGGVGDGAG